MEDLCPVSHNLEVPFVKRTEYQVLNADGDTGRSPFTVRRLVRAGAARICQER